MKRVWIGVVAAVLAGCGSVETQRSEALDVRVPLRVAVLPFRDVASGTPLWSVPFAAGLDLAPVLSDDRLTREFAATIFREKVQGNLRRTHFQVLNLAVVDSLLERHEVDLVAAYEAPREEVSRRLGALLGADAVVFGDVLAWDREYYLVESVVTAGVGVELRETDDGALLFASSVTDSESSGISKLPIVYSPDGAAQAVLGESLKGLRNTLFIALTDDVSRALVEELAPPAEVRASAPAPVIRFVAHTGRAGVVGGQDLVVVAAGSVGAQATFRLGRGAPVPMVEGAPGAYRGIVRLSAAHDLEAEALEVRFVSPELLVTTYAAPVGVRAPEAVSLR